MWPKCKVKIVVEPRLLRIARLEWTTEDMKASSFFIKSPTFQKMKAWCDEQLLKKIVGHGATEEYRKGWQECQAMYEQFGQAQSKLDDSTEMTAMQFYEEDE